MRYALLGTILLLTATRSRADHRPALTWEGQVDGTAVLRIQGDRVDVDNRGGSVSGANVRMTTPLPDYARTYQRRKPEGRARVRILEQPNRKITSRRWSGWIRSAERRSLFRSISFGTTEATRHGRTEIAPETAIRGMGLTGPQTTETGPIPMATEIPVHAAAGMTGTIRTIARILTVASYRLTVDTREIPGITVAW